MFCGTVNNIILGNLSPIGPKHQKQPPQCPTLSSPLKTNENQTSKQKTPSFDLYSPAQLIELTGHIFCRIFVPILQDNFKSNHGRGKKTQN